jgi:hypothetical protein
MTARDPASAYALLNLLQKEKLKNKFSLIVVAQSPAHEILKNFKDKMEREQHKFLVFEEPEMALDQCREILDKYPVDLVLTGISGPDFGVDEAVLSIAQERNIPRYALQSYWGDLNESLQGRPGTIFVIDEEAADQTNKRCQCRTVITGSLKHQEYCQLDILKLRRNYRLNVGLDKNELLIGFYGQPLDFMHGYCETITDAAKELSEFNEKYKLLYRPHPKETAQLREWTIKVFEKSGVEIILDTNEEVEIGLCACDVVLSAFSTCGYDAQQLNRVSTIPLNVTVYLFFNRELKNWFREYTKFENIPLVNSGLAFQVNSVDGINNVINKALRSEIKHEIWENIHNTLPNPKYASEKIINTIYEDWLILGSKKSI